MQAHRPGEILVVDSDTDFLSLASTTLNRRGHAVRICAYVEEAREHIERHFFDAVLCANTLPDSSGPEFCAWIKSHEDLQGLPVALLVDAANLENSADPLANLGFGNSQFFGPTAPDDFILRPIRPEELIVRVGALLKLRRYRDEIGNALTTLLAIAEGVEEQDQRSRGHCRRLAIMAVLLGAAVGCDEYQLLTLERAGYLHDIGKVSVSGGLLEKSQPLSPREMEMIKKHCELGENLCKPVAALQPVLPIIRCHHERGDGTGYPDGLRFDKIPELAQLFSIVDVYDSLRTWRPYRPPLGDAQAVEVMRHEVDRGFWNRQFFELFSRQVVPGLNEQLDSHHVLWPKE